MKYISNNIKKLVKDFNQETVIKEFDNINYKKELQIKLIDRLKSFKDKKSQLIYILDFLFKLGNLSYKDITLFSKISKTDIKILSKYLPKNIALSLKQSHSLSKDILKNISLNDFVCAEYIKPIYQEFFDDNVKSIQKSKSYVIDNFGFKHHISDFKKLEYFSPSRLRKYIDSAPNYSVDDIAKYNQAEKHAVKLLKRKHPSKDFICVTDRWFFNKTNHMQGIPDCIFINKNTKEIIVYEIKNTTKKTAYHIAQGIFYENLLGRNIKCKIAYVFDFKLHDIIDIPRCEVVDNLSKFFKKNNNDIYQNLKDQEDISLDIIREYSNIIQDIKNYQEKPTDIDDMSVKEAIDNLKKAADIDLKIKQLELEKKELRIEDAQDIIKEFAKDKLDFCDEDKTKKQIVTEDRVIQIQPSKQFSKNKTYDLEINELKKKLKSIKSNEVLDIENRIKELENQSKYKKTIIKVDFINRGVI